MKHILKILNQSKAHWQYIVSRFANRQYFDYLLVLIAFMIGIYLEWEMYDIALFCFVVWAILRSYSRQKIAKLASMSLFLALVCLLLNKDSRAEEFSIYAFYFLCLAVVVGIAEFNKENKDAEK